MRKIALFAKPLTKSRSMRDLDDVLHVFERAGVEVDRMETWENRAVGESVRHAIERGVDAIVVCGGDGTVFDILQGLAGSEIPLGIVPFGTGNVLAQNLHIPKKAADAARCLLSAKPRAVPLGKITVCECGSTQTWFFAIAAGMGIHAAMMETAHRFQKGRVGQTAYFAAGVKALFSHPVQQFEMKIETVEGKIFETRASEAIALRVASLNLWRTGGDLEFPFLRVASVKDESRWCLTKASVEAIFLGVGQRKSRFKKSGAARYEDVLRVECRPIPRFIYRAPIMVQADGEILGTSSATIEMAGLSVRLLSGLT